MRDRKPFHSRKPMWLLLPALLYLGSAAASACSSEDRIALSQMGYTSEQIDAQCNSGGNTFVTPSMPQASFCVTQAGSCYLSGQSMVGSQCWCQTQAGYTVPGVAQ